MIESRAQLLFSFFLCICWKRKEKEREGESIPLLTTVEEGHEQHTESS